MRQYSGSPSGGYTSHPPTSLLRTPRACWSTHGPGGARAACGAPGQTGWGAEDLILQTIEQTRAAGGTGLIRHTGDAISPPLMDDTLTQQGFEKTEGPDVLVFELGKDPDPKLPDLPVSHNVSTWLVRDRDDRPSPRERRRGRRLFRVDLERSGHARSTRAGSENSTPADRDARARTASRAPSGIWPPSRAAEAKDSRSRVPMARNWPVRPSGCGAPERSRGTVGAPAPTVPS